MKFCRNWSRELRKLQNSSKNSPSLLLAIIRTFGLQYLWQNFKNFLTFGVLRMAMPIFLGRIIYFANLFYEEAKRSSIEGANATLLQDSLKADNYNNNSNNSELINRWFKLSSRENVILNSLFLGLMIFLNFCISHPVFMAEYRYGMHCRVAVTRLIYEVEEKRKHFVTFVDKLLSSSFFFSFSLSYQKALKVTNSALQRITTGQVTNLISNDANRFDMGYIYACYLYLSPIETVVGIWLLYTYLGRSAFAALGLVLVYIPLQTGVANVLSRLRAASASLTDDRLRLLAEILPAMRVIKVGK